MPFSFERAEDGICFEVKDDTSTEPHDNVWATCDNEQDAFVIATAMNMMDARNTNGTPFELLSDVQAEIIGAGEAIADAVLESYPFGLLNRQCKYCGVTWNVGSALLEKAGIDDDVRKVPKDAVHLPTCLITVMGEWKVLAADRLNEAIQRSKA